MNKAQFGNCCNTKASTKVVSERAAYLRQTSQPRNYLIALPLYRGTDGNSDKIIK